jgi:signal transduction histidine kinase
MMIAFFAFFIAWLVIVFLPSMYVLATGSSLTELEPAAREFLVLHYRVWPAALIIFAGVFVYTLFVSRRIAGPIYRINAVLRQMIEGEYPEKVTLRSGDFFGETAELLERLSRKAASERGKTESRENMPRGPAVK